MPSHLWNVRLRAALTFGLALVLLAAMTVWIATRERRAPRASSIDQLSSKVPVGGPIVLPIVSTESPELPNRDVFLKDCLICHSPRMSLTQPDLSEKQWTEIVHKMAANYGAPMSKEDEAKIVGYLRAVQANRVNE